MAGIRSLLKKWMPGLLAFTVLFASAPYIRPVMAEQASSSVQAQIDALLTSYAPSVAQTQTVTDAMTFTHPGIGLTKAMLDKMRNKVRAYEEPWATAFVKYAATTGTHPTMRILDPNDTRDYVNIPSGGSGSDGYNIVRNMEQDAETAFTQVIMWFVTGNEVYRQNAMNLIREWSKVESIGSIYDEQIRVSLAVYSFSMAADILRSSPSNTTAYDWTVTDTANFTHFLSIMRSKYDRYTHWMNQHSMCAEALMASSVFLDNPADYAIAVKRATTNPELGGNYDFSDPSNPHNSDGSIIAQIRAVIYNASTGAAVNPANIEVVEMGRDQAHPYGDIDGLSRIAMMAELQGTKVDPAAGTVSTAPNSVTVFHFLNDRLLAGANYLTKYNLFHSVTYIPTYVTSSGSIYSSLAATQGTVYGGISTIYGYYKYVHPKSDLATNENSKYLAQAFDQIYAAGTGADGVLFYAQ